MAKRPKTARKASKKSKAPARGRSKTAKAGAIKETARLKRELSEALERQKATGEILAAISGSTFNLQTILDTLTLSAARLCNADMATITRQGEGGHFYHVTNYNFPPDWVSYSRALPLGPERGSVVGRALLEKRAVQVTDVLADPEYAYREPAKKAGFRTFLGVPLLRDGQPVGVFSLCRRTVAPFSKGQIESLSSFANQAVIAIENARLFDEVKAKTDDLAEALEQQTATADVLKVISRSAFELQTVLETLVESAARLCSAEIANIWRPKGDGFRLAASFAISGKDKARQENKKYLESLVLTPGRGSIVGRVLEARRAVQIEDLRHDAEFQLTELVTIGDYRTLLGVPLLRQGIPIGVMTLVRCTVEPFSEKQIELVTTFADQAVIAIENVRLFEEVKAKTDDLAESLQQQTATADVLKVISRSAFDLQTVLETLVQSAARLSDAAYCFIFRRDGEKYRLASSHGFAPEYRDWMGQQEIEPGRQTLVGKTALTGGIVHIPDVLTDSDYAWGESIRRGNFRAMLGIPLMREGISIGVIAACRPVPKPFTDKQIELVSTFADQAVIAIENARLFDEVSARTRDLAESLEQQTATSEVLSAISSSLEELEPLFQKILENAVRVCGAKFGTLNLYDGKMYNSVAGYNLPHEYAEGQLHKPFAPHPKSGLGAVAATHRPVQIEDIRTQAPYREGHPAVVAMSDLAGARTIAIVPMLKDERLVGTIAIYRQEVSRFNDKQITLLSNFAQQAVIAIENNRLLRELRESLQQQTATADVLKVISRSAFNLPTVLQTLIESAARLCDADKANITRQRDGVFYLTEFVGFPQGFVEYVRDVPMKPDKGTAVGRALLEGTVVHIPDVTADPDYTFVEGQKIGDYRTMLCVPMLREGEALGVFALTRSEVRPFGDKQIELVTTFADQAAIAIKNARLFDEVQQRTRALSRSLEDLRAAQDRLIQTEKLASLGQLTAGIAHEIKNPLNFINNFSAVSVELVDELGELLAPAPLDDKTREDTGELARLLRDNLKKVVQHGKRADSIVKNMLLHSREGSGDRRAVDINCWSAKASTSPTTARVPKKETSRSGSTRTSIPPPAKRRCCRRRSPACCST